MAILSWKKAKPGTMLGGKGVLVPYRSQQRQSSDTAPETGNPNKPVDPSMRQMRRPDLAARHKELSSQLIADFINNLNRSALESEARQHAFGCENCWPPDADAAWAARGKLSSFTELIDEPHFHVMVLKCPDCGQRFVSVFSEIIDWKDGEDPQFWTLLPITEAEAEILIRKSNTLTDRELNELGLGRRSLLRDNLKEGPLQTKWGKGIWVGMHN